MRLASAFCIVALGLASAACRTSGYRAAGDQDVTAKLKTLGVEGKTYVNDVGQVASIRLGHVYVAGNDLLVEDIHGHLTYVDGATLNPIWAYYGMSKPFDKKPDFTPSAVIGISGGKLFVISRGNGTTDIEPRRLDVVPSGAAVANDATIYVPTFGTPSGNKTMQSVGLASGYAGWGWRTNNDIVGGMAKGGPDAGDEIYFATQDGVVYAFPTYNTTERSPEVGWSTALNGAVTNDLTIDGDDLGVVLTDGRLVVLDRITGRIRWQAHASSRESAEGSASFSKKYAFYRCGGELRAFDRTTGAKAFAVKGAVSYVAERGGRILFAGAGDTLISIDSATGKVLGTATLPGWHFPSRPEPNSTIYAVSRNGALMSIELGF